MSGGVESASQSPSCTYRITAVARSLLIHTTGEGENNRVYFQDCCEDKDRQQDEKCLVSRGPAHRKYPGCIACCRHHHDPMSCLPVGSEYYSKGE